MGRCLSKSNDVPQPRKLTEGEKLTNVYGLKDSTKRSKDQLYSCSVMLDIKLIEICEDVYQATDAEK
jgi:hypothetical protein